jgi:hypothetical protein
MHWLIKTISRLALTCIVSLGAAGITSWAVGWGEDSASDAEASPGELAAPSPGEVIESRFAVAPDFTSVSVPSANTVTTRAGDTDVMSSLIFSPYAIYQSASADAAGLSSPLANAPPSDTAEPEVTVTTASVNRAVSATLSPERRPTQVPVHRARRNNALLNDAQIASIKDRLKLTSDQQPYWPQVESALRAITWRHQGEGTKPAPNEPRTLDPNAVEGLKSAAIPLIMRLRDDQKSEVRKLARLMGLESVASQL